MTAKILNKTMYFSILILTNDVKRSKSKDEAGIDVTSFLGGQIFIEIFHAKFQKSIAFYNDLRIFHLIKLKRSSF